MSYAFEILSGIWIFSDMLKLPVEFFNDLGSGHIYGTNTTVFDILG